VTVQVQVIGEERHLASAIGLAAFRVVVEAIENAYRHGRADEVEVVVAFLPGRLQVVVGTVGRASTSAPRRRGSGARGPSA